MPKHILILTRTFPPDSGAVGHLVKELAEEFFRNGQTVTVVAGGGGQAVVENDAFRLVRVGSLPFSRQSHFKRALSYLSLYPALFLAAARQKRPDVVVTTTDPPLQAVLGVALKLFFRCRLIHWSQDMYPEMAEEAGVLKKGGRFANFLRWISTAALQRHDRVVSIGRCMTERLRSRGLAAGKITEIANWTDPGWIQPMENAANDFWKQENLAGHFVVVYSGNLGLAHTFTEILGAAEILQNRAPDVLFLFIGEGPRRAEAEKETESRSLSNIRFLPAQPWKTLSQSLGAGQVHLVSLRANLSGLVVPSKFYGGMAAGRPCLFIGPPESEIARLILENQTGRVIFSGDAAALVQAILEYRDSPTTCLADGQRARALGEEATLQNAARKFLKDISGNPQMHLPAGDRQALSKD